MTLKPAIELARSTHRHFPNESPDYRRARLELLAEEIELRRHIERVAAQRRALPPGGEVPQDYAFAGEQGPVRLSQMFGRHDTLITYNWMYNARRKRPCPMCTCMLGALDAETPDLLQQVSLAIVATSPIERMVEFKRERGWRHLPLYSSAGNTFNADYAGESPGDDDRPGFNVFVRQDGRIRHFYGDELEPQTADPGEDARGAPDLMPIWTLLDLTPRGRRPDWYPQLEYPKA